MNTSFPVPFLAALLLASGCAPVINNVQIPPATDGEEITIDAEIKPYLTYMRTPELGVGPYPPPHGPFVDSGTMTEIANNQYQGTLPGQAYGGHELRISVPYTQGLLPFIRSTQHRHERFYVDGSDACFTFDGEGVRTDGWQVDGIFDGDSANKVADPDLIFYWIEFNNWPEPINAADPDDLRGSAVFEIDRLQFSDDQDLYTTNFWRVDYVSPDLEDRAEWQNMEGVSLRFATEATGLYVQPLIKIRKDNNEIRHLFERDDQNDTVFHEIASETWHVIDFPAQLPADTAAVLSIEIRVFGAPDKLPFNFDLENFLDGVCPM